MKLADFVGCHWERVRLSPGGIYIKDSDTDKKKKNRKRGLKKKSQTTKKKTRQPVLNSLTALERGGTKGTLQSLIEESFSCRKREKVSSIKGHAR